MEISTTLIEFQTALKAAEVDADGTITVALDGATVRLRFAELLRERAEALVADLLAMNAALIDTMYSD
jgi:hypothetical protein